MAIECCKHCVAPKRYPGCHDHCPEYQEQKAIHDANREEQNKKNYISDGIYQQQTRAIERTIGKRRSGHPFKTKMIKER